MAKSKYETHVQPKLFLVESWARDGVIDKDIAGKLGIAYSTFSVYKNKFGELSEALKKGKEVIDYEVENALLKRAIGYEYTEERIETSPKDGVKVTQTVKHIPADTAAAFIWLKNRRPDKWRDKVNFGAAEREGALGYKVNFGAAEREGALGYKVNFGAAEREGALGYKVMARGETDGGSTDEGSGVIVLAQVDDGA